MIGGIHLSDYILKQLPVINPEIYDKICEWQLDTSFYSWLVNYAFELTYTAYDLHLVRPRLWLLRPTLALE